MILQAEKFLGVDFLDCEEELSFEDIDIEYEELQDIETEKEKFRNVREQAAMLLYIIDDYTKVWYPGYFRTRFEVRSGYKLAVQRGAKLQETEVFNILFKFDGGLHGDAVALFCRGPQNQEWIMLLADNTEYRIDEEKRSYFDAARTLVFKGNMSSDEHSRLIENMKLLNIGSRCANSLQHEYGHVLQYRIWDSLGIDVREDERSLYQWFMDIGYADIVAKRIFNFFEKPDPIYLLKESFVEDYRIGLNMDHKKDIFELPNAHCFYGDFSNPELLVEGVSIVKRAIEMYAGTISTFKGGQASSEPDRVQIVSEVMREVSASGFEPIRARTTAHDHQSILERLKGKQQLHIVQS